MIDERAFALFLRYCNEYQKTWGKSAPWAKWDRRDARIGAMVPIIDIGRKEGIKATEALHLIAHQAKLEGSDAPPPHMICEQWGQKLLASALATKRFYVADTPSIGNLERCMVEIRKLAETKRILESVLHSVYARKFDKSWPKVFSKRTEKQIASVEKLFPDSFVDFCASYRAWRNIEENRGMYMRFVHDVFDREFHGDTRHGYESLILPR